VIWVRPAIDFTAVCELIVAVLETDFANPDVATCAATGYLSMWLARARFSAGPAVIHIVRGINLASVGVHIIAVVPGAVAHTNRTFTGGFAAESSRFGQIAGNAVTARTAEARVVESNALQHPLHFAFFLFLLFRAGGDTLPSELLLVDGETACY
jgi:hypothetical protein